MSIRVLPQEVAAAIAAGEVVERPASVVKELIENALDAGASRIRVAIEQGGRSLVEVADDGRGIPASEAPLAFARHATSKLATLEDLFAIRTLGFRGEALASIGAVARMELVTRAQEEAVGVRVRVEGGAVAPPEPVGAPAGTVATVRDLFFNVPARQKFLRSETTERRRIETLVTRYALAYPSVHFHLTVDGREAFRSSGTGDVRETLAEVFGLDVARQMIPLPGSAAGSIDVRGFISPPSVQRSNRRELTVFVNGRWVQDASLGAAVLQAYQGLLMVGRYPLAVILLTVPPGEVDVNVHPAKTEVRFRDPDRVFAVVQRVVRATLLGQAPPPLEPTWSWDRGSWGQTSRAINPDWAAATGLAREPEVWTPNVQPGLAGPGVPLLRAVGQVGAAYLVAEGPDGLYLVDQHAAHERILYEKLQAARSSGSVEAQTLLEPTSLHLPARQAELLEPRLGALRHLGFDVEPFGGGSFRLRSLPVLLAGLAPEAALRAVVEDFEEDEAPLGEEEERRLAARVCKRAAVKSGQVLSLAEQERLLRDLEACQSPRTCPHGRPTMIHLSVETLERQFGRRG
ncbi:MAG: DNA mismatch repair endonuclease MutL [Chloroflexota bacterium]